MRERTKYVGVYVRKHHTRRHLGRQDVCYDITFKDYNQKKIWIKVGWASEGITAQAASALRAEKMRELRGLSAHQLASQKDLTFGKAFDMYAKEHLPRTKRPAFAHETYRHVSPHLAKKHITQIKPYDIEKIINSMQLANYSSKTISHAIGLVKAVYGKLVVWGMFTGTIPTKGCVLPKIDNARIRFLTEDEASALLTSIKARSHTWYYISFISLYTGMRLGEILALQWQDIDISGSTIFVRDAKAGSRSVLMSDAVAKMFVDLKAVSVSTYIFPARGKDMPTKAASRTFARTVQDLGLNEGISDTRQRVVFHTLRHTFASWLAIKGVPLYVISQLLGHKTLEMTQRYAHLCPDIKRDAVNLLNTTLHQ